MMQHTRLHSLVLLLALALVAALPACNFASRGETIVITATPSSAALLPADVTPTVPYVTPTPHIVPTPTLPTNVVFADAESALRNGDYVTAVSYFQDVLNRPNADPALYADAAYGLGESALREGLYADAAEVLSGFLSDYPNDARVPHAVFLRGDAYLGLGDWSAAINDFETYLRLRPNIIDSYAHERIGDAYLALGLPEKSLEAYAKAAADNREPSSLAALRERVAAGYLNAGNIAQAIAQYDAILGFAENSFYKASIEWQAAQILLNAEDFAGGYTRLQRIVDQYPASWQAYQAVGKLLDVGIEVDPWQQARIYYFNEDYGAAIDALNTYTSEAEVVTAEAILMLARAYREAGNPQAAITTLQNLLDTYPDSPAFGEAWLEQGRTYFLSGDYDNAIQRYTALADQYPLLPESPEALWRAGYIYSTLNNTDAALATFDILGQKFPGTQWAMDGLHLGATMAFNAGDTARAAQLFGQLAATGSGEQQAAAYLWIGRLYQLDGKDDLARQSFNAAATADPGGYYSSRAADLLNGHEPFTPPAQVRFEFDETAYINEAEAWLRSTFGITQEGPLYLLGESLKTDPRMIRGQELMVVGASGSAFEAAENEFTALREAVRDDPLATYQLAIYFRDMDLYRLSIEAAATLIESANIPTLQAPSYIARLRFPVYYKDLVIPNAAKYDLDPLLVFALIRQESLFEGFATSYAAAQGLMQIIPDTAADIAAQLGRTDFTNSDVYRPYINVEFGTYYLRWVLDNFAKGLPYVALAGYNGGPGNAAQWLSISGPDLDLFVETIRFDETQRYVRRIYEQYNVYAALYGVVS